MLGGNPGGLGRSPGVGSNLNLKDLSDRFPNLFLIYSTGADYLEKYLFNMTISDCGSFKNPRHI